MAAEGLTSLRSVCADLKAFGFGIILRTSSLCSVVCGTQTGALGRSKLLVFSGNAIGPPSQAKVGRWRTRRDSNPRYRFRYTPLAGERFQPLSHRSRVLVDGRDIITFPCFRQWEACLNRRFFPSLPNSISTKKATQIGSPFDELYSAETEPSSSEPFQESLGLQGE